MTDLLEKAFREAAKLPPEEQDRLASILLASLKSEQGWDDLFAKSQELLEELADRALSEEEAGETEPLVPGEL